MDNSPTIETLTTELIVQNIGRPNAIAQVGEAKGLGYGSFSITKIDTSQSNILKDLQDVTILKKFQQLEVLKLPNNKLENLSFIQSLPLLHTLDASHNSLSEALEYASPACTTDESKGHPWSKGEDYVGSLLHEVNLSHNKITLLKGVNLRKHTQIRILNVSNNMLTDICSLEILGNLEELYAGNNRLTNMDWLLCPKIEVVDLSHNDISMIAKLGNLPFLRKLHLQNNQICGLSGLGVSNTLRVADLRNNKIDELYEVDFLAEPNVPVLHSLLLSGNPLCLTYGDSFRRRVIKRLQQLVYLDEIKVSALEKVNALNAYGEDVDNRKKVHDKYLVNEVPWVQRRILIPDEGNGQTKSDMVLQRVSSDLVQTTTSGVVQKASEDKEAEEAMNLYFSLQ